MSASQSESLPLVSVIVPNYNYAAYLPERLASISGQTYGNFEVILLDDCSTDGSLQLLKDYARKESRVSRLEVNEQNGGSPFRQWLKGLRLAKGEYVWIAESDDAADPSFLAECVGMLRRHPSAVLCHTGSLSVDEAGAPLAEDYDDWTAAHLRHTEQVYDGVSFVRRNMYWKNYVYNASCVVFRRETALDIPTDLWTSSQACGDWAFWTQMALKGDVATIRKKLNRFRRHSSSVTALSGAGEEKYLATMTECMDITYSIEQELGVGSYRRAVCHGNYLLLFKRNPMSAETRKQLVDHLAKQTDHLVRDYVVYRIYRFLKKFFKSMDLMRRDRL